jgi:hypothetical protein
MRISEIIKCASDLAELEKKALNLSPAVLKVIGAGGKSVAPKLIGPGVGRAVQKPFTGLVGPGLRGRALRGTTALPKNSLKLGAPASRAGINTASLGQSGSIIPEVKAVPAMLQNSSKNALISTRPPAMPGANASPAFATNVDTAAASTLPGASYAAPTATEAVESAAKASLLDRLKGMSPGMKTGLTVGGAGLAGGGLGAWMNSGSGYEDAMSDAQLMMMNQQRQYEEALGRMQNRGLFDRIMNTGG